MSDKPIIFSTPMIKALMSGRKTQTRRIQNGRNAFSKGDRLWVRERGWISKEIALFQFAHFVGNEDSSRLSPARGTPWKAVPSIHMPRSVSRMTLNVTDVRVEQLNDISEADAITEGLKPDSCAGQRMWDPGPPHGLFGDPRVAFRMIWEDINGRGSWEANPWVAAISFEVVKANIDQIGAGP